MRLEGFLSLIACVVLLAGLALSLKALHQHTRASVSAMGQSRSSQ